MLPPKGYILDMSFHNYLINTQSFADKIRCFCDMMPSTVFAFFSPNGHSLCLLRTYFRLSGRLDFLQGSAWNDVAIIGAVCDVIAIQRHDVNTHRTRTFQYSRWQNDGIIYRATNKSARLCIPNTHKSEFIIHQSECKYEDI